MFKKIEPKPEHKCYACGQNKWWLSQGQYICGVCHENPVETIARLEEERRMANGK